MDLGVRPRVGEPRRDVEKASNWAVKSRSKLVVSFSFRDCRGVGEGVLSVRRMVCAVEGVIGARARGVDYCQSVGFTLEGILCTYLVDESIFQGTLS